MLVVDILLIMVMTAKLLLYVWWNSEVWNKDIVLFFLCFGKNTFCKIREIYIDDSKEK